MPDITMCQAVCTKSAKCYRHEQVVSISHFFSLMMILKKDTIMILSKKLLMAVMIFFLQPKWVKVGYDI